MSNEPLADLLQGFEHVLEEVNRLSSVLRQVLEAQQRGERLSDEMIADYQAQLKCVEADHVRMSEMVGRLWAVLGEERSH